MFELAMVVLAIVGAMWCFGALIRGLFKLTVGLFAVVFGGMFALLAIGVAALFVVPLVLFALMPFLLPALAVAALVWLVARPSRRHGGSTRASFG